MKKTTIYASFILSALLMACTTSPVRADATLSPTATEIAAETIAVQVTTVQSSGLSQAQIDGLRYMREEEKLAHDVYVYLYQLWGQSTFQNIAASETTHGEAILNLLNTYQIADPAVGLAEGKFVDPALQSLYDQLIITGSQSLADAIKVGAAIEEIDILDLKKHIEETGVAEIRQVYEELLKGSYNHLRSFVFVLDRQTGEIYVPQYLSVEEYQAILSGVSNGQGSQGGRGGRGVGGGNR